MSRLPPAAFEFKCATCGEIHHGMPSLRAPAPLSYLLIPEQERAARCLIDTDGCIVDEKHFFVNGSIEIAVQGQHEPFAWGVWVSLSEASFEQWVETFGQRERDHIGPFFGWLNSSLPGYPPTPGLKTRVHLRNDFIRPLIELEQSGHPLALEQRDGISARRLAEIYELAFHGEAG